MISEIISKMQLYDEQLSTLFETLFTINHKQGSAYYREDRVEKREIVKCKMPCL